MTIETEDYINRDSMKADKVIRASNGWRSLHTDFINNKESDGYRVTFVNGIDNEENSPERIAERALEIKNQKRIDFLKEKIEDDSITFSQVKEFLRIKEGLI